MREVWLISLDDTDEVGHPKSTGLLAEALRQRLIERAIPTRFVSRHQLLLDERINYTSHNSAMAFIASLTPREAEDFITEAERFLLKECAASAEPGIALAKRSEIREESRLIAWGKRAKSDYLTKEKAHEEAKRAGVYLNELQGKGRGVIGALAGIALRLEGNEGRVRGKFRLPEAGLSVEEILERGIAECMLEEGFRAVDPKARVKGGGNLKLIVRAGLATLLVRQESGIWRALEVEEARRF